MFRTSKNKILFSLTIFDHSLVVNIKHFTRMYVNFLLWSNFLTGVTYPKISHTLCFFKNQYLNFKYHVLFFSNTVTKVNPQMDKNKHHLLLLHLDFNLSSNAIQIARNNNSVYGKNLVVQIIAWKWISMLHRGTLWLEWFLSLCTSNQIQR